MDPREVRDKILTLLRSNFDSDELTMIDSAIEEVIGSLKITEQETSIIVTNNCMPDILQYLVRKKAKGLTDGTLEQYSLTLKAFCLGVPKALPDITEWDILNFLDDYERRRHISKRRKDTMRVILNGFFRYMADCGRIKSNPMATIEPIKYQKNVRQPLTDMELEKLRYACTKKKERALLEFFFATGCRVSEAVNVNISDIDFNQGTLKVLGKGNKERLVLLNAAALIAIQNYLATREDEEDALWISDRKPYHRIKKEALEKIIRKLGEKAELGRRVYPHLIRHTTATFLLRHGMPLEQVQDYLGHENINTTRIYAKTDVSAMIASYRGIFG